ncbi:YceI family protein [Lysobacter sp. N42]|jgi:polyisoprenoid-binding protein YceI|uniref:YceI family protein n=1 Tax=Lysobacter sp. N42 TaxID=2545719 RepID=UPI00104AAB63|nr:YceI family protein [Lysobacter sp. N42]TCZ86021.1 polyisoprenoid-binding protein [Lysobacter sp. N42]
MPRTPRPALALLAGLLLAAPAAADEPADFAVDPVHTRVLVAVDHAGFSRSLGTASGSTGRVRFAEGWAGAEVDVTVPLDALDFGDARWNAAVQELLGTGRHPRARFVSTRVTPRDATRAEVCGDLALAGTTRPLCMDVTFNALKRHPLPPFRRTVGFSATARLDRMEFGLDRWASMVGREVELRIELEASRGLGAPAATPAPSTEDPRR